MTATLTQFCIEGLHGQTRVIEIPIKDNCLVLVGENGTGKSTVTNLLYYTLTQQWRRVAEYKFDAIEVNASGETVRLTHQDFELLVQREAVRFRGEVQRRFPVDFVKRVYPFIEQEMLFESDDTDEEVLIPRISEQAQIPRAVAREFYVAHHPGFKLKKALVQQLKRLATWQFGQFLYLPTYRRIEQDLKSIFRGIEIEEKVREFRDRLRKRERTTFIELVEFGMEDVDRTIQRRMSQIKESVRTGLSALTGTYLREVIRGLQDNPDLSVLRSLDRNAFQSNPLI